ncbi:DUF3768 domain-containing protein [Novosphingobium sp. PASSN1]|uniref:DUF3768 domain-containing protein n=1 Tax=Novosphingobium sp. PASSN1 TaxID=2015561 RepID=UPI000BDA6359|nr:DUF3768 domain-containing protein [Novosphingobium sp. PASSN1]OYU34654.1 MAG: hypothetical protein CFE35_14865 [Novosphingobium sp. PASSN1]
MTRHDEATRLQRVRKIRELNDRLRRTGLGGTVMLTRAVASLDAEDITELLRLVREFADFNRNNDPWGEHDFGEVVLNGIRYYWKIDAYDLAREWASPDASDAAVTRRVLTVMTGEDL